MSNKDQCYILSDKNIPVIIELYNNGVTYEDIAETIKCSIGILQRGIKLLIKHGYITRRKNPTAKKKTKTSAQIEQIKQLGKQRRKYTYTFSDFDKTKQNELVLTKNFTKLFLQKEFILAYLNDDYINMLHWLKYKYGLVPYSSECSERYGFERRELTVIKDYPSTKENNQKILTYANEIELLYINDLLGNRGAVIAQLNAILYECCYRLELLLNSGFDSLIEDLAPARIYNLLSTNLPMTLDSNRDYLDFLLYPLFKKYLLSLDINISTHEVLELIENEEFNFKQLFCKSESLILEEYSKRRRAHLEQKNKKHYACTTDNLQVVETL